MSGSIMAGGGVNSAIPLEAGQGVPQTNPLASAGQLVGTLQGINALKLFPGQMQLQQQQIQGGAASLAAHLNQVGANAMIPALADPNLTMAKLTHYAGAAEGVANGTTQGILGQVAAIPFPPDTPQWAQAAKAIIASQAQTSPESAVAQAAGVPGTQTVGNRIVAGVTAPAIAGGGFTGATSTPVALSPGEAAQRVPGPPGPHGEPTTVPLGAVTPNAISQLNMGNGRLREGLPAALQNPNAPPAPIAGQLTTGMGPAATEAMGTAGRQAAQGFQAIADQGVQARGQDAVLANMQNDLAQFTSGTNADKTLGFKRFIQSWSPTAGGLFGIDPKSIAAQESFDKLTNSPTPRAREAMRGCGSIRGPIPATIFRQPVPISSSGSFAATPITPRRASSSRHNFRTRPTCRGLRQSRRRISILRSSNTTG
jgi:hypothetical protein